MTVRFLALYETPTDPEAFDRHYREVHIPLGRQLPGLRRYAVGRDVAAVRGVPYYLVAELEWDTMAAGVFSVTVAGPPAPAGTDAGR